MRVTVYKFKISDVIETYERRIREASGKEDISYTTAVYEPKCKKKVVTEWGRGRTIFVNLDALITNLIKKDNVTKGYVIVASDHTTSGCYVNHFEKGIMDDLNLDLDKKYPFKPKNYLHNIWDHKYVNADAHLKAMSVGKSAQVLVVDGKLQLGKFEDIIYAEFDYRPDKTFTVSLYGDE